MNEVEVKIIEIRKRRIKTNNAIIVKDLLTMKRIIE